MDYRNRLQGLLEEKTCHLMPCCFDALSAKLIEQEGYPLTFMSGFAASASRLGAPDLGLMSYGEVVDQVRCITAVLKIPLIADGDTGYGNAMNVRRTIYGLAQAGASAVMIEDQVSPKRCGHTPGKEVVGRDEAFDRVRAAIDARDEVTAEGGPKVLILGRTDARHELGLGEAINRATKFADLGADILFIESPKTEEEMIEICRSVPGPKMANIVEGGLTPELRPDVLGEIGYSLAAYPLTLLSASMLAMRDTLRDMKANRQPRLMDFIELRDRVGFEDYYALSERYSTSKR